MLAGLDDLDPRGSEITHGAADLAVERAGVGWIIERDVADPKAPGMKGGGAVAHRREEEDGALAVARNVGGFLRDFHHEDGVERGIHVGEGRRVVCELVAEDDDEVADGCGDGGGAEGVPCLFVVRSGHGCGVSPWHGLVCVCSGSGARWRQHEQGDDAAGGPGEGSDPVGGDERSGGGGIEGTGERLVARDLDEERREPAEDQEECAADRQWTRGPAGEEDRRDAGDFDEHERADDERGAAHVGALVVGVPLNADLREEWVVDDLDEPDQANHRDGREGVGVECEGACEVDGHADRVGARGTRVMGSEASLAICCGGLRAIS